MAEPERDFFLSSAALEAGLVSDALVFMKRWVQVAPTQVSFAQVKLIGKVFRSYMSTRRQAWSTLHRLFQSSKGELVAMYRAKIEREMEAAGTDFSSLLTQHILPQTTETQSKAYVWKLIADAWRYIAEVSIDEAHSKAAESALDGYLKASAIALELPPCSPVRLAVAINFSVFYFDILSNPTRAFKLSRSAYDTAVPAIHNVSEQEREEAETAIDILKENLNVWASQVN